ncbi:anaerobic sulfite reductase subunit A [Vibrio harveyi]|nr:anaerobic sulfite reductase subunit A [Vibrio harveyi]
MPKFLTTQQMGSAIEALRQSYKVMAPVYEEYAGRFAHTPNLDYQELERYDHTINWSGKRKAISHPKKSSSQLPKPCFGLTPTSCENPASMRVLCFCFSELVTSMRSKALITCF